MRTVFMIFMAVWPQVFMVGLSQLLLTVKNWLKDMSVINLYTF